MIPAEMEYPRSVLSAFEDGCMMDIRLRVAVEFLKSPLYQGALIGLNADGRKQAAFSALHLAEEVFALAQAKGWVSPLPDSPELAHDLRVHIERNVKAQVHQQEVGQREQARMQPVPRVFNG